MAVSSGASDRLRLQGNGANTEHTETPNATASIVDLTPSSPQRRRKLTSEVQPSTDKKTSQPLFVDLITEGPQQKKLSCTSLTDDPQPSIPLVKAKPEFPETKTPAEVVHRPTSSSSNNCPEHMLHKSHLNSYTQMTSRTFPKYHTINEGSSHATRFRTSVEVDGVLYTSPNTYSHVKAAEHDAARYALGCIFQKMKDEVSALIAEETVVCKSILNEFAAKMVMEMPTYSTEKKCDGLISIFISSAYFNGKTYMGSKGKTKKEAEQLAARAVILSHLENSELSPVISMIIKSKFKHLSALPICSIGTSGTVSCGPRNEIIVATTTQESNVGPVVDAGLNSLAAVVPEAPASLGEATLVAPIATLPVATSSQTSSAPLGSPVIRELQILKTELKSLADPSVPSPIGSLPPAALNLPDEGLKKKKKKKRKRIGRNVGSEALGR